MVELPLGATEDRMWNNKSKKFFQSSTFEPGLLARAVNLN
jgi:Mg-chelatase subunit ChlI